MKRKGNDSWRNFEKQIGMKRTGNLFGPKKNFGRVPTEILVQRMSATPSGRMKKFEPMDTRDFIPFAAFYDELNIENIKAACEEFYHESTNSCDILASDRGPSCTNMEQLKGKKVFLVRFVPTSTTSSLGRNNKNLTQVDIKEQSGPSKSTFPKSVSIGDLLNAGKLIKPVEQHQEQIQLEDFDLGSGSWVKKESITFTIDCQKFASGGFCDAFYAYSTHPQLPSSKLVLKEYKADTIKTIETSMNMTAEEHTRKQVQLHTVARNLAYQSSKRLPKEFGKAFQYNKIYYGVKNGIPVTIEEFVPGCFKKYVNNDGTCLLQIQSDKEDEEIFLKAECLSHFTYDHSGKQLMLLDLQGTGYNLYDPEIATAELKDGNEIYFCAGNTTYMGIQKFLSEHICNRFCNMLSFTT